MSFSFPKPWIPLTISTQQGKLACEFTPPPPTNTLSCLLPELFPNTKPANKSSCCLSALHRPVQAPPHMFPENELSEFLDSPSQEDQRSKVFHLSLRFYLKEF